MILRRPCLIPATAGLLAAALLGGPACTPASRSSSAATAERAGPAPAAGELARPLARLPMLGPPVPGAPAGVTAFVDVAVVPMDSERVLPHRTVLIQQGRIMALGAASQLPLPAGATPIDGRGRYLLPGLADMHQHLGPANYTAEDPLYRAPYIPPESLVARRLFELLADGVTTVRNVDYKDPDQGPPGWRACIQTFVLSGPALLRLRAQAAAGTLWSPHLYVAGQWAPPQFIQPANWCPELALPAPRLDSVAAYVAAYQAAGYDHLKVHNEAPEVFDSILAAARAVGLPVAGHVSDLAHALAGGMRSIEHLGGYGRTDETPDSAIRAWAVATRRAGTWNVIPGGGGGDAVVIRALQEAGAGLLLGTDEPLGRDVHGPLQYLVQRVGLTPYQALATTTRNVAQYFQQLADRGTIAVGQRADLVLLNGNPLVDIRNTRHPAGVMIGGRWLSRAELDERLAMIEAAGGTGRPPHGIDGECGVCMDSVRARLWRALGVAPDSTGAAAPGAR